MIGWAFTKLVDGLEVWETLSTVIGGGVALTVLLALMVAVDEARPSFGVSVASDWALLRRTRGLGIEICGGWLGEERASEMVGGDWIVVVVGEGRDLMRR